MLKNNTKFVDEMFGYSKKSIYYKEEKEASDTDASGYIKSEKKNAENGLHNNRLSTFIGGGELARTTPTNIDEDALLKSERTILPSAPVVVIVQIGRWCLNYTENNAE